MCLCVDSNVMLHIEYLLEIYICILNILFLAFSLYWSVREATHKLQCVQKLLSVLLTEKRIPTFFRHLHAFLLLSNLPLFLFFFFDFYQLVEEKDNIDFCPRKLLSILVGPFSLLSVIYYCFYPAQDTSYI